MHTLFSFGKNCIEHFLTTALCWMWTRMGKAWSWLYRLYGLSGKKNRVSQWHKTGRRGKKWDIAACPRGARTGCSIGILGPCTYCILPDVANTYRTHISSLSLLPHLAALPGTHHLHSSAGTYWRPLTQVPEEAYIEQRWVRGSPIP
jgi:hypothetical protein